MKTIIPRLFFALSILATSSFALAADGGTPEEAVAMVKKAAAYIKANGIEKTIAEVHNPKGQFVDRDMYILISVIGGTSIANGGNPKMVGKANLSDLKDVDGKYFVREFDEVATTKGSGWVDYKWLDPVTKKIVQKSTYVEKYDKYRIACGIYKK